MTWAECLSAAQSLGKWPALTGDKNKGWDDMVPGCFELDNKNSKNMEEGAAMYANMPHGQVWFNNKPGNYHQSGFAVCRIENIGALAAVARSGQWPLNPSYNFPGLPLTKPCSSPLLVPIPHSLSPCPLA